VDFFGNARKTNNAVDSGAVEFAGGGGGGGATLTASMAPTSLAFGNQAIGTASGPRILTVTNTGTGALAGGTFTFGGGTPQPFSRITTGTFPAGAPNCNAAGTLAIGASCTIKVVFRPPTATAFSRTLTVSYTGATVTPSPVTLTGTGGLNGTLTFTSATNGTLGTV